ncbi:hypothetical protein BI380_25630 [Delftia tsuruhatensis]|uniref:Uncharacterized protein n=1 Tax=Delftia tsuruhatensis TaxID=180282 RepID=A0ABM6EA66_9BURK|nr:hypothetical protein BI380_25630 [Delftia tsuruhatensis]
MIDHLNTDRPLFKPYQDMPVFSVPGQCLYPQIGMNSTGGKYQAVACVHAIFFVFRYLYIVQHSRALVGY